MRTHTGERPFKCEMCNTAFRESVRLKIQRCTLMNDHLSVKSSAAFSENGSLKTHKHPHTGNDHVCAKSVVLHSVKLLTTLMNDYLSVNSSAMHSL